MFILLLIIVIVIIFITIINVWLCLPGSCGKCGLVLFVMKLMKQRNGLQIGHFC